MQNFTVSEHEKLNTAVALGFFDGLHKGHRRVILSAVEQKKKRTFARVLYICSKSEGGSRKIF